MESFLYNSAGVCEIQNSGGCLKSICELSPEWTAKLQEKGVFTNVGHSYRCANAPHLPYYTYRIKKGR